jgi:uncharacterized protein (TIGR03435 family)
MAQTGPPPAFEAASIKPADPAAHGSSWNTKDRRFMATNQTLKNLVMIAYDLKPYQIAGTTGWMNSEAFDINAELDVAGFGALPGADQPRLRAQAIDAQILVALQSLLEDRFQLKIHYETKTVSAYALTVAKGGFKLQPAQNDGNSSSNWSNNKAVARHLDMAHLAASLANLLNQPVANLTKLDGVYDFTLEWTPDDQRARGLDALVGPSIFTALEEQLGLKLEAQKVPVDVVVVDGAEHPSAN